MIKGNPVRIYYPVTHSATGARITGDAANHTIYISTGTTVVDITSDVTITELTAGNTPLGEYTFELPDDYTDVDVASVIVKSSNTLVDAIIPPIDLYFTEPEVTLTQASRRAVVNTLLGTTVTDTEDNTVNCVLYNMIGTNTKIATYPVYSEIDIDFPTTEEIATAVLSSPVTNALCTEVYSLAGTIMGGFKSSMNPANGKWTIFKPNGDTYFIRDFVTNPDLEPVSVIS